MKTDLTTLSTDEIEKMAAELFNPPHIVGCGEYPVVLDDWRPCDPNSNQIVVHILPVLREMDATVNVFHGVVGYEIDIIMDLAQGEWFTSIKRVGTDPDQINRALLECCIEAKEKINE